MARETNAPIFPKAQIHVPAAEYKFWTNPAITAGAAKRIQAVFPGWKNIRQFEGDIEVVPGVRAIATQWSHARPYQLPRGLGQPAAHRARRRDQHAGPVPAQSGLDRGVRRRSHLADANRRKIFDRVIADKVTSRVPLR